MAATTAASERLVRDLVEHVNERDYAALSDVLAESFVFVDPTIPEGEVHGPEGFESLIREIEQGSPDFHIEVLDILADGEVVMLEALYSGTHRGEFFGLPHSSRRSLGRSEAPLRGP